ncbi:hypothetical protein THOM_0759 [Trachipleistophora hominis]|uniref:Uncharacterized protein n=1 Tax=Trachipleistophora hominis TaxID=72359 RepID=L7JXV9_TRAHO|nr:hypothetical protein THOM_0759 [Trachipleistophora hominis]
MINFKFEALRSMRNVKNVKRTKNVNYIDEHLDLILCNKLENGKRRLKRTKELELIHKLHQE